MAMEDFKSAFNPELGLRMDVPPGIGPESLLGRLRNVAGAMLHLVGDLFGNTPPPRDHYRKTTPRGMTEANLKAYLGVEH